jgi:hypothetical protein
MNEMGRNDPAAMVEAAQALGRYSATPWIGEVDVPAATVITGRDNLVHPARQHRMADAIGGARKFAVDGDHLVCARRPQRFVPPLLDACHWVAGEARRRRSVTGGGSASEARR